MTQSVCRDPISPRLLRLLLVFSITAITGCHNRETDVDSPPFANLSNAHATVSVFFAHSIKALQNETVVVQVKDKYGNDVRDAAVSVALTMPTMLMPPNVARMKQGLSGKYSGTVIFTMPGDWKADVTATKAGRSIAEIAVVEHVD